MLLSGTHRLQTASPASCQGEPQPVAGMLQAWDDLAMTRQCRYACRAPQGLPAVLQGGQVGCSPADAVSMDLGRHCVPTAQQSLDQARASQGRAALPGAGQPDGLHQPEWLQSLHRVKRVGCRQSRWQPQETLSCWGVADLLGADLLCRGPEDMLNDAGV